jgi:hypothetical protein
MRIHVVFRLYASEKNEKRVAVCSASTDLLTLNTPHHAFRGSMFHCFTIAAIGLEFMFEIRLIDISASYLIGIPLRSISITSAFVLIANEVGLCEHSRQQQRNSHFNAKDGTLSDEDLWELWNYGRIRLRSGALFRALILYGTITTHVNYSAEHPLPKQYKAVPLHHHHAANVILGMRHTAAKRRRPISVGPALRSAGAKMQGLDITALGLQERTLGDLAMLGMQAWHMSLRRLWRMK